MKNAFGGLLAALALAAAAAAPAMAQGTLPIAVEVRLDAGIPTGDDGDGLETGIGWGVTAALDLTPTFALYGGYSNFEFERDDALVDNTLEDEGFSLGGRVLLGTGGAVWTPYAQFGALFHDDEVGFEVGLGAEYPVGNALSLTPLVRYRDVSGASYVAVGAGLNIRL